MRRAHIPQTTRREQDVGLTPAAVMGRVLPRWRGQMSSLFSSMEIDGNPRDLAIDCDEAIVWVGGVVQRLDSEGAVQWESLYQGYAVSIDEAGDVYALTPPGYGMGGTLVKFRGV